MIRRTIAAALLAGLGSPVLASQFASQTYDQAANLANGKTQSNAAYDGNAARGAVPFPAAAAAPTAPAQTILTPAHPAAAEAPVPAPSPEATEKLFGVRNVLYGGGAPVENGLGRPLGALAGVAVGLGIGFAMSKLLR
jgi:hypothetical protein